MKLKVIYPSRSKNFVGQKFISKSLILGVLLNGITINSFAGILSEDGRYETFEGSSIAIDDVLEEKNVNIEIEGNTLINICDIYNKVLSNGSANGYSKENGRIKVDYDTPVTTGMSLDEKNLLKKGVTYTCIMNITENSLNQKAEFYPMLWHMATNVKGSQFVTPDDIGIHKITFTATMDYNLKMAYKSPGQYESGVRGMLEFTNIIVLEGDYYDKDVSYFEGVKSTGELENNSISIGIENKNILPNNFINKSWTESYIANTRIASEFIPYKKNQEYTVYGLMGNVYKDVFVEYSNELYELGETNSENIVREMISHYKKSEYVTFMPNQNYKYMAIYTYSLDYPEDYINTAEISLCEGNVVPSEYIEHNSKGFNVNLESPLKGINYGLKDRIIKRNGQWIIERNIGQYTITGDENWKNDNVDANNAHNTYRMMLNFPTLKSGRASIISDKFPFKTNYTVTEDSSEGIFGSLGGSTLYIDISKEKIDNIPGGSLAEKFKTWLSENPVTIVYELLNTYEDVVNDNLSFDLYLYTTHISANSTIPANMKVTVDRTINRAVEAIELVKTNPTIENLSRARMWVNLLDESIKKDGLQNEINNITDLDDMVLERKTATANLDVYVICENMLSLSLDTSSVTFEDFSGVEDLEELNAINLTINSSLPYQVNAYMPTEIKGSENSNIMDKDILNIKADGETVYNTFTDADTPIVLLDNQPEGNGNLHGVDLMLKGNISHAKDVYKTTIKFEVVQK